MKTRAYYRGAYDAANHSRPQYGSKDYLRGYRNHIIKSNLIKAVAVVLAYFLVISVVKAESPLAIEKFHAGMTFDEMMHDKKVRDIVRFEVCQGLRPLVVFDHEIEDAKRQVHALRLLNKEEEYCA